MPGLDFDEWPEKRAVPASCRRRVAGRAPGRSSGRAGGQRGFSLLEIPIAGCILAVCLAAALFFWLQSGRGEKRGYASVHAMRDLNLVYVRLRDDLSSILVDRAIAAQNGAPVDICLSRSGTGGLTRELRFFKVYSHVPETLQPVAGQIAYTLEGAQPPYTLRRGIYPVSGGGVSASPAETHGYCRDALTSFSVGFYRRDPATGAMSEVTGDVVKYDSPEIPDCLFLEIVHKDATRIRGYVTVASRYVRSKERLKALFFVDDWLVPGAAVTAGAAVSAVEYTPGNSLNVGGTGVVLSVVNMR